MTRGRILEGVVRAYSRTNPDNLGPSQPHLECVFHLSGPVSVLALRVVGELYLYQ